MKPFTLAYPDAVRLRVEIENLDTIFQRVAADGASAIDRADFAASMKALCSVTPETPEDVMEFLGANPTSMPAWKRKPHNVIDGARAPSLSPLHASPRVRAAMRSISRSLPKLAPSASAIAREPVTAEAVRVWDDFAKRDPGRARTLLAYVVVGHAVATARRSGPVMARAFHRYVRETRLPKEHASPRWLTWSLATIEVVSGVRLESRWEEALAAELRRCA